MTINRVWHMPNSKTFQIKPIRDIILKYAHGKIIDPFANSNKLATITNDLDDQYDTDYHLDATDFLSIFESESVDTVLYDPPYSPRQVAECYKALGKTVDMQTTQASYWSKQKEQIGRIVKPGGCVITCGWNSGGIGKKYGFEIVEILLIAHGGWHNDTIVTVERKRGGDEQPTVDSVVVVHGRWKSSDFISGMLTCTNCGAQRNPKFKIGGGAWNYCPSCGANMMDGGNEDA